MIDAAFVIFLSFLLFVALAGYYGARPLVALLDQWIETIREDLRTSVETVEIVQEQYTEAMKRLEAFRTEGQHLQECAHEDFSRLRDQAEKEFRHLLSLKEKEYEVKTQQIYQEKLGLLRLDLFQRALLLFENRIQKEIPVSSLQAFTSQAISQINVLPQ